MDRDVLDTIEREIDREVRALFPASALQQAVLLQYGDDPEIEPGDLWVRVLLDADGPEDDWEPALTAFEQTNKAAIEQFTGYLATKLREIRLVEYTFSNNPVTCDGKGPRAIVHTAQCLSDIQEWEHGEVTFVLAALGPAGLETVDTLIMAGIAATRAEAIRWSLDRIRERPEYQRLRELRCAAEVMDRDVMDPIEREIDEEVRARFPGSAVRQAVLLQYGDDPEIGPGDLWVRVLLDADGPEDYEETLTAFEPGQQDGDRAVHGLPGSKAPGDQAGRVHVQQQPRHPRRPRAPREQSRRGATAGHPGAGARRGYPVAGPAGTGWPGNAGHADHGGNRGHARGGHPVGPGSRPRAASVPAAP